MTAYLLDHLFSRPDPAAQRSRALAQAYDLLLDLEQKSRREVWVDLFYVVLELDKQADQVQEIQA